MAGMSEDRADDLPALAIRRPWLVAVLNLLIVIAGLGAWLGVEVRDHLRVAFHGCSFVVSSHGRPHRRDEAGTGHCE